MRFDRQHARILDIVEVRRTDRLRERGTLGQSKEHMQLHALDVARAMLGRPFIKAMSFERHRARVQQAQQLSTLTAQLPARLLHQRLGQLDEHLHRA